MSFQLRGSPKRTSMLAVQGRVHGGALHGWTYAFEGFVLDAQLVLRIKLAVTRPHWPFPKAVSLGRRDFAGLELDASLQVDPAQSIQQINAAGPIADAVLAGWLAGDAQSRALIRAQLSDGQAEKLQEYADWSIAERRRARGAPKARRGTGEGADGSTAQDLDAHTSTGSGYGLGGMSEAT